MAKIYYENSADLSLVRSKKVAVFGYGSQGHAHALNLRDSGVEVRIALEPQSRSRRKAQDAGFEVLAPKEAALWGDVLVLLVPDTVQPKLYQEAIAPALSANETLLFAHGFNVHFKTIQPPPEIDVVMVAPKSPGHRVREVFAEGGGTPGLMAVHQDPSGNARALALSYARGIGCTRAGVIETTFAEETETDLFGEQAVLCGGVSALIKAGFETLVEAGYQPEIAYFECMHELKLIVDLMYRGGLNFMRYSVSDTAEYGDYTGGPKVVTNETYATLRRMLAEIRNGNFAREWISENEKGRPWFDQVRSREREHLIEKVGSQLRSMMPFVNPVNISPDQTETNPQANKTIEEKATAAV
ncbi:MAG TPA: ketol-acid reductoisomerase [Terriglobales bacterium]|nr:ketol-acid reductoisomerase [Terriglobales bacterium]